MAFTTSNWDLNLLFIILEYIFYNYIFLYGKYLKKDVVYRSISLKQSDICSLGSMIKVKFWDSIIVAIPSSIANILM